MEVTNGVVIANIADDSADPVEIVRQQARFHFAAEEVAEDAAEILVPRIRQERAAIGQHTDEKGQKPHIRQRFELLFHPVLLVEEPPAGAVLHFAREGAVVEVGDQRREEVIRVRIEVVNDRFREVSVAVEVVEVTGKRATVSAVGHRVAPGVRAEPVEDSRRVVPHRADVQLRRPIFLGVETAQIGEENRRQRERFLRRNRETVQNLHKRF